MRVEDAVSLLRDAVGFGTSLGLDVEKATATLETAETRVGFSGETYVVALIGGTGVGKSSLLNALAEETVSEASVLRPTTQRPAAWLAGSAHEETLPLLDWLEVDRVITHQDESLSNVAVLDLPDFDSIAPEHREMVDRLLPRVDVVVWVVDPEKYDDERFHEYLREVGPSLPSVRVILNKIDQLNEKDQATISKDLARRLGEIHLADVAIREISSTTGAGVAGLKSELKEEANAKKVIADRIRSDAARQVEGLLRGAGLSADGGFTPLIDEAQLSQYGKDATTAALQIVDPDGMVGQVRLMYREQAAIGAGSILGRLFSVFRVMTGHRHRNADPKSFLLNWRNRGDSGRTVNPVRAAYLDATKTLSPHARAAVLDRFKPEQVRKSIESAMDVSVRETAKELPSKPPFLVRALSPLQWLVTLVLLAATAWYLIIIFASGVPVGTVDLEYLGPVPAPLVLILIAVIASVLIGLFARLFSALASRRKGRQLRDRLHTEITAKLAKEAFGPLLAIEKDREALARVGSQILVANGTQPAKHS